MWNGCFQLDQNSQLFTEVVLTISTIPTTGYEFPTAQHSHQHLILSDFLIFSQFVNILWLLVCIFSVIIVEIEYLSIFLLTIWIPLCVVFVQNFWIVFLVTDLWDLIYSKYLFCLSFFTLWLVPWRSYLSSPPYLEVLGYLLKLYSFDFHSLVFINWN